MTDETGNTIPTGVNIDKAECNGSRLQYRIDIVRITDPEPIVALVQCGHQMKDIFRPCTDELGNRLVLVVPLTKKNTFFTIADRREAIITNQDAV